MDISQDIIKVRDLLEKAPEVLIVTHERPTFDSMGSALALSLGLASLGKKVTVACPDPVTVELSGFIGVNKVVSELGKKNFIISLDYIEGSIEKVSYNIEGDKFNLVIEPRPGVEPFTQDKVHFSHAGTAANAIIAVDTIHLGGLKKLYDQDKELFASKTLVNIDRHPNNAQYGQINVINPDASSTVEVISQLLSALGVKLTEDIATNVLNALYGATNNFQNQNVTPQAFELAGACLKAGAKRFGVKEPITREPEQKLGESEFTPQSVEQGTQEAKEAAPPDWLKPKIFKSSNH